MHEEQAVVWRTWRRIATTQQCPTPERTGWCRHALGPVCIAVSSTQKWCRWYRKRSDSNQTGHRTFVALAQAQRFLHCRCLRSVRWSHISWVEVPTGTIEKGQQVEQCQEQHKFSVKLLDYSDLFIFCVVFAQGVCSPQSRSSFIFLLMFGLVAWQIVLGGCTRFASICDNWMASIMSGEAPTSSVGLLMLTHMTSRRWWLSRRWLWWCRITSVRVHGSRVIPGTFRGSWSYSLAKQHSHSKYHCEDHRAWHIPGGYLQWAASCMLSEACCYLTHQQNAGIPLGGPKRSAAGISAHHSTVGL